MPSLFELTDAYPQQPTGLPVEQPIPDNIPRVYINTAENPPQSTDNSGFWSNLGMAGVDDKSGTNENPVIKKLFGLGGEERYQLWPEKVVREAIAAPHDALNTNEPVTSQDLIAPAQAVSALAGTGGLAGADATLGSTAFLRPALKYENKIYKAPVGGQHLDALPAHLAEDFNTKAMAGEDINHYNFGFMNHKGQFLSREAALDYAVKEGLVDPSAGQYGTLTSTLMADSSKPGTAIESLAKTQPFYSALEHNVNSISQSKMTGDQWLGTLANKPGVKPEELDWTGVKSFLEERGKQSVTKAELQEHLQNNKVELKEVDKGDLKELPEGSKIHRTEGGKNFSGQTMPDTYHVELPDGTTNRAVWKSPEAAVENMLGSFPKTKYHSYQLPGGEPNSYREKLLTLPPTKNTLNQFKVINEHGQVESTWADKAKADAWAAKNNYTVREDKPIILNGGYKSSHWDEPNILAHIRMNDRMINGKKSLHIEEIQSDWHQQGRDRGYNNPLKADELEELNKLRKKYQNSHDEKSTEKLSPEENKRFEELDNRNLNLKFSNSVPNAPFKKTWHELALKRMIREAAEKGYDRLSWTPGEAQAARYDLSKSVDSINVKPEHGNKLVEINPKGEKQIGVYVNEKGDVIPNAGYDVHAKPYEGKSLADIVGKETADKILKLEKGQLAGDNLKIGGEGMKGFYDSIVPKALEKISGEKVKQERINKPTFNVTDEKLPNGREVYDVKVDGKLYSSFHTREEAEAVAAKAEKEKKGTQIHYIDLSPALKDKAMHKGFPLFSSTHIFIPVAGNPFDQK